MNFFKKQKQESRKQPYAQEKKEGGINREIGIDIYTLLYIRQITSKYLWYSTGNSTQDSVMIHTGKYSKKERIYVYV